MKSPNQGLRASLTRSGAPTPPVISRPNEATIRTEMHTCSLYCFSMSQSAKISVDDAIAWLKQQRMYVNIMYNMQYSRAQPV